MAAYKAVIKKDTSKLRKERVTRAPTKEELKAPFIPMKQQLCQQVDESAAHGKLRCALYDLAAVHAPQKLMQLVTLIFLVQGAIEPDLDLLEYFAGDMAAACQSGLQ